MGRRAASYGTRGTRGVYARSSLPPAQVDPSWKSSVPGVSFTQGSQSTFDLTPYTANFSAQAHKFAIGTGTLPAGVTLNPTVGYAYDGFSPPATASGIVVRIVDTADADFDRRKTSAGVIRWFDFNQAADLGGGFGSNYGTISGANGSMSLDTSVKASGTSSLRFDLSSSGNNWNWFTNFSSDLSKLYGANSEFYIQFKCRVGATVLQDWAHKLTLIGSGDDGTNLYSSCTDLEICIQSYANATSMIPANQFPHMYNACPGSCGGSFNFFEDIGGGNYELQNAVSPQCLYQDATKAGCIHYAADQWMVFQVGVQVGSRITSGGHYWFSGSRIRTWMQLSPTSPEVLISDWTTGTTPGSAIGLCAGHGATGNQRYGKITLLPYTQNSVASPRAGSVWYDELIISEQKIPAALA